MEYSDRNGCDSPQSAVAVAAPVPPNWRRPSLFNDPFPGFSGTLFQSALIVPLVNEMRAALQRLSN